MSNTIPSYWKPVNKNLAGDFIGFTFDNIHSSDFNLIRVSNGSRYESNLLPSFQDATVQGEGKDGLFYFGSTFKEKNLKISTAFDDLTEENYRKLAETFSDKKLHKLWFDETPYKAYYVKLKQSPVFKNLCFDENYISNGEEKIKRKYRGEMDLEFTCLPSWGEARASHLNQILPDEEFVLVAQKERYQGIMHNHYLVGENKDAKEVSLEFAPKQFYKYYGKNGATLMDSYNFNEWEIASRLEIKNEEQRETIESFESIERRYENKGYGEFKKEVAEVVANLLTEIQDKYHKFNDIEVLNEILRIGATKAQIVANKTLLRTTKALGLN